MNGYDDNGNRSERRDGQFYTGYYDDIYMDTSDVEYTPLAGSSGPSGSPEEDDWHESRDVRRGSSGKRILALLLAVCMIGGIGAAAIRHYAAGSRPDGAQRSMPALEDKAPSGVASAESGTAGGGKVVYTIASSENALTRQEIFVKASPWVVAITSQVQTPFGSGKATGTGIIMSEDGYIITNHHVIEGATKVTVAVNGGDEYEALVVGSEAKTDIAVLKIVAEGLQAAEFGKSSELVVGDDAIVIGNPLGTEFADTMTSGIISSTEREVQIDRYMMTLIQTDAAVNPGNSGGPLINSRGQVVGVVNAKIAQDDVEGIGFAIPIDKALSIANDLIEYGYVANRPMLGITVQSISEQQAYYYGYEAGITVTSVTEGSPADVAGMKVGDKILAFNGVEVATTDELNFQKEKCSIGDTATITVERDGRELTLTVVLTAGTVA